MRKIPPGTIAFTVIALPESFRRDNLQMGVIEPVAVFIEVAGSRLRISAQQGLAVFKTVANPPLVRSHPFVEHLLKAVRITDIDILQAVIAGRKIGHKGGTLQVREDERHFDAGVEKDERSAH